MNDALSLDATFALIVFLLPLAYSPGPGNMVFAVNGARFGVAATAAASAGYHVATFIVTAAIGLGFAEAARLAPQLFPLITIAGSLYVLWLAVKLMRAGVAGHEGEARPAGFRDGVLLLLFNPKAYLIIALMFTQFLGTDDAQTGNGARAMQVIAITAIFTVNNVIAFAVWAAAGDVMARAFRDEHHARRLNLLFGAMLAAVAVWMLVR